MTGSAAPVRVMIAGIGGASLGTEINKALQLAGGYQVYGCDISPTAYGLYEPTFARTYRIDREEYVESVIGACADAGASWVIPGGEEPTRLLGRAAARLSGASLRLVGNSEEVMNVFSDKEATFRRLCECGVTIPRTAAVNSARDLDAVGLPCIVKPATGSGGSVSVFFASSGDEAMLYAEYILRNGGRPIAQEYLDIAEGEYTIGVLSLPDGRIAGSIALRRDLNAKLSVAYKGRGGIVSSGYSQGLIEDNRDFCLQAERIAAAVGSRGPLNIQGRIRNGTLVPFEINPRFSASTYLRAMAGFNEVDILLRYLRSGEEPARVPIRPGWYLRGLAERYVPKDSLK